MTPLLDLLNIADSGFPSGSFGHSSGLEYAVQAGWVTEAGQLADWARGALVHSFIPLDLRAAVKAWFLEDGLAVQGPATVAQAWLDLNDGLAAFRTSRLQRMASAQVGRSFLRSVVDFYAPLEPGCQTILGERAASATALENAIQFPVVWGSVCRRLDIGLAEMAEALVFSALRQMTMVAMRVVPVGQRDAFTVQTHLLRELAFPLDWEAEAGLELESFAPGFDLAGLGMENLASKYFRS